MQDALGIRHLTPELEIVPVGLRGGGKAANHDPPAASDRVHIIGHVVSSAIITGDRPGSGHAGEITNRQTSAVSRLTIVPRRVSSTSVAEKLTRQK